MEIPHYLPPRTSKLNWHRLGINLNIDFQVKTSNLAQVDMNILTKFPPKVGSSPEVQCTENIKEGLKQ